jgi:two-component system sensor histidine kinase YesM
MKHVEQGHFDVMLQVHSFDEINELAAGFNQMVRRVNGLIERVKIISDSEKNAQLHVLQSQVNPHFLYNTLDMIYWMLDEKEHEQLGNVVLSLSNMFRYSSNWEHASQVTLADELEQIGHYLYIIQMRLGGRLSFETDIDPQWLALRLPKMTLQPILENAIIHGLDKQSPDREGIIRITTQTQGERLFIHVEDNGAGMEPGRLRHVMDSLGDSNVESPKGIGLGNVHRRLAMRFGQEYGLRLESVPGQGTRVSVVVPGCAEEMLRREA